jgi:hypothetical protein
MFNRWLNSYNCGTILRGCSSMTRKIAFGGYGPRMVYSSKSAYLAQFNGSYSAFKAKSIWKAHAEGKHKFFMWLLIQAKILTADKLSQRNWPCNPVCVLCDQEPETAIHLCLKCPFALEVWELVRSWTNNLIMPPSSDIQSFDSWWAAVLQNKSKEDQLTVSGLLMYFT